MQEVTLVGIDLGKHSFHLHGQDGHGKAVFRSVVNPGFFTQETGTEGYHAALIVAILKVLYAYSEYHEVSTTPLFKHYLELLSAKQLTG